MKFKLVFLFALAVAILFWYTYDSLKPPFKAGDAVPVFALSDLNGKTVRLSELRGRPVLVHFWASWCGQCAEEMPLLSDLNRVMPDLEILAISIDEGGQDAVKAFFRGELPLFTVLLDSDANVADMYKTYKVPESFLIDSRGRFLYRFVGAVDWTSLKINQSLQRLIKSSNIN